MGRVELQPLLHLFGSSLVALTGVEAQGVGTVSLRRSNLLESRVCDCASPFPPPSFIHSLSAIDSQTTD